MGTRKRMFLVKRCKQKSHETPANTEDFAINMGYTPVYRRYTAGATPSRRGGARKEGGKRKRDECRKQKASAALEMQNNQMVTRPDWAGYQRRPGAALGRVTGESSDLPGLKVRKRLALSGTQLHLRSRVVHAMS